MALDGAAQQGSRGKVLVVDDSGLALKIIRKRLERAGFQVIARQEALGTCSAILQENPDLVLLDLQMPTLGGDLVIDLILKRRRIPVIFHSSAEQDVLSRVSRDAGAVGYIRKTPSDATFAAQLEVLLRRARQDFDTEIGLAPAATPA